MTSYKIQQGPQFNPQLSKDNGRKETSLASNLLAEFGYSQYMSVKYSPSLPRVHTNTLHTNEELNHHTHN
jgi:hypothetical protein